MTVNELWEILESLKKTYGNAKVKFSCNAPLDKSEEVEIDDWKKSNILNEIYLLSYDI